MGETLRLIFAAVFVLALTGCAAVNERVALALAVKHGLDPAHEYRTFSIPSGSMAPTIRISDMILVDESVYAGKDPQRGDIIVFKPPVRSKNPFTKRIIAVPGDRLSIRHGAIAVNGRPPAAPMRAFRPDYDLSVAAYTIAVDGTPLDTRFANIPRRSRWSAADRLPAGCYIVVGDSVNNSEDSHIWGCTALRGTISTGQRRGEPAELVGKVVSIIPADHPFGS